MADLLSELDLTKQINDKPEYRDKVMNCNSPCSTSSASCSTASATSFSSLKDPTPPARAA